ncbi:MAG: hypothetical protein EA417_08460 [Gammaproteobacteria bacterium]|nr:MAG: hypothetical protein EA417_08460 [Gammaproteobacteria bacterium]
MNFQLKQLGQGIALASLLAAAGTAYGATQGTLGADSTGTLDVTVSIEDRVQISALNDIPLGTYSGTGPLNGSDDFCVYRNGTGLYSLQVVGSENTGPGGVFRLTNGTDFITYSVSVNDSPLLDGEDVDGTGSSTSVVCGGSTNANLGVEVAEGDLQSAPSGNYSDRITLVVSPR